MSCPWLLFAYFLNNQQPWSLLYAISSDGLHWTTLNGGQNIVNGTPNGMRDVFVNEDQSGAYRMVATSNYGQGTSILTWQSPDLIQWPAESVLDLMGPGKIPANATVEYLWAPEWHWDASTSSYMVFWAAKGSGLLPPVPSAGCAGSDSARFGFFKAYTTDWQTFTSPELLFDPGCYVTGEGGIDGDIVYDQDSPDAPWVLVFKDARGTTDGHTAEENRGIRLVRSATLGGPYTNASLSPSWLVPTLVEAPELVASPDRGPGGWLLYYDCSFWPTPDGWPRPPYGVAQAPTLNGVGVSHNFSVYPSACTGAGRDLSMPRGATHGSFLCLNDTQLAQLLQAFPSNL